MEWNKIFITGIEEIDKQHKTLFDTIVKLNKQENRDLDKKEIEEILNYLVDYTLFHFKHEEDYMTQIRYKDLEKHKDVHNNFVAELNKIITNYKNDNSVTSAALYLFLIKWLQEHIAVEDQKYVKNFTKMSFKDFINIIEPNLTRFNSDNNKDSKRIKFLLNLYSRINYSEIKTVSATLKSSKFLLNKGIITKNEDKTLRDYIIEKQDLRSIIESNDPIKYEIIENIDSMYAKDNAIGHITGSCWILNSSMDSVLLTHHKKLGIWIQLGGHSDGEVSPLEISIREGREESGLELILLDNKPFHLDTFIIPKNNNVLEHLHFDYTFIFKAKSDNYIISDESHDLKWVPLKDIEDITKEDNVLQMRNKTYDYIKQEKK